MFFSCDLLRSLHRTYTLYHSHRKPAAALTVRTVVSTPTRVTLVTSRSSSRHPILRSSVRRTRTSLPLHHLLVSTGGRLLVDASRLLVLPPRLRELVWVGQARSWECRRGSCFDVRWALLSSYVCVCHVAKTRRDHTWIMHLPRARTSQVQ